MKNKQTKISLLDCTLRDGGYINDWSFGEESLRGILGSLYAAGLDYIEIGFIDEGSGANNGRVGPGKTIFSPELRRNELGEEYELAKIVGMINYTEAAKKGQPAGDIFPAPEESAYDLIRIMFKKADMAGAIGLAGELKAKGYGVFLQPVSVTSYSQEELMELITAAGEIGPDAIYIVDTYGLLDERGLIRIYDMMDEALDFGIAIGYHGHNNMQLAYSNGKAMMERATRRGERDIIIDGSLYGMGKTAGNPPTELLVAALKDLERPGEQEMQSNQDIAASPLYGLPRYDLPKSGSHGYDMAQIMNAIEKYILPIIGRRPWGYDLYYFIASYTGCHPKYIEKMREKGFTAGEILNRALAIPESEKLFFNEKYI